MRKKKICKIKIQNCCKGAISLFLAVLLTPFLTILMLLVETGRYNSVVSILDEAMGVSSNSLLASYDKYMKDRWGLLSIDQEIDINTQYTQFLTENSGVFANSIELSDIKTTGEFALNDSEILNNQVLEFCTLNAPTKLATNFLNLSELISKLESFANLGSFFSIFGSAAGAIDSAITLSDSADKLKEKADEIDKLKSEYNTNYGAFKTAVDNLSSALSEERPEDEDEAKKYDKNITELQKKVDTAASKYKTTLTNIANTLQEYKDLMEDCNDAIESIKSEIASAANTALQLATEKKKKSDELKELNAKITEMEKNGANTSTPAIYTQSIERKTELERELAEIATQEGIASATKNGLSNVSDSWKESFNSYSDATLGELVKSFKNLATKVGKFKSSSVTSSTEIKDSDYHHLSIAGYISSADIDAYLDAQAKELSDGSLTALIDGIISFFNSLLKLQLFYDPSLSAYIDINYYIENLGGLPGADSADGGVLAIITDIGNLISSANSFSEKLLTLKWGKALKEAKKILDTIISLGNNILSFAVSIANNIAGIFTSYDRLYYTTYTTFNLPCRTDFYSGTPGFTAMTGYSLTYDSLPKKTQSSTLTLVDDLVVLIDQIKTASKGTGTDLTFCGAELEYILFGSNSEVANQMFAFVSLYLLRLLLNLPAISLNAEVQALAASSTLGYPIIMALEYFVEPLLDTILLVNDSSVDFYKTQIYLTPTGLPTYLIELTSLLKGMTSSDKSAMSTEIAEAFGMSADDYNYQQTLKKYSDVKVSSPPGIFKFDYREYCFLLLLLTVSKEQQMARLSNLIQMETLNYYKNTGKDYVFNLAHAYSFVNAEVTVDVKQIMPSLIDSSLFSVTRTQHRGY